MLALTCPWEKLWPASTFILAQVSSDSLSLVHGNDDDINKLELDMNKPIQTNLDMSSITSCTVRQCWHHRDIHIQQRRTMAAWTMAAASDIIIIIIIIMISYNLLLTVGNLQRATHEPSLSKEVIWVQNRLPTKPHVTDKIFFHFERFLTKTGNDMLSFGMQHSANQNNITSSNWEPQANLLYKNYLHDNHRILRFDKL